ncbi:CPA2 family monovalent cation:H+ antiporter-2 [Thermosporothrix hazakensis]|jgi:CPA2 family monovalent cation:H+ antiporter-2|uniref:CPA2 family monovalent cation:H+ antiporter-2 n=2 Tax=Thermosporothrix TaxID=768650 RepID=A0A326U7V3_THEHA|nr:cation:proton antiporter [Thermosporothrix hazakensis]PZW29265.1 CPA2 family monovalent cation:H+ antiporter-2 [Thermosporothrix hazakensis]BBH86195.1 sodium/hydrogen exchanger [Thermosporothrix sp. COM3]GCE45383.1 sodium/hydrogen exchanger [Thermosporothrix hazakensis]
MHGFPILINMTLALAAAFIGGFLAHKLRFPPMAGYLLAGVVIGPLTPGPSGDLNTIQQLAELGVIFLLFDVGLHFSIRDLWAVRAIAFPGALLQTGVITLLVLWLSRLWGWSLTSGVLLGIAISIASTVVMLRNFMDRGILNSLAGRIALGWLVFEDILAVLILVLLPTFSAAASSTWWQITGLALLKALAFIVLMLVVGARLIPWLLAHLAHVRSHELFTVAIIVITLGTAVGASLLFGVSLALGAFLAGVVINESRLSQQASAEILPFREMFTALFFVSVGMLVNVSSFWTASSMVLIITALIIGGKWLLTLLQGAFFIRSATTTLELAAGRSQIGEFSFILGETSIALGLMAKEQYSLLLAGALLSILLNPLLFWLIRPLRAGIQHVPPLWRLFERQIPKTLEDRSMYQHVIVIGYGRVGEHMVSVLTQLHIPHLVVDLDVERVEQLERHHIPVLYGDAANSEILRYAHVEDARAVVITLPDETSAQIVVANVHEMAPGVPIIVRAATRAGIQQLFALGATDVIHPELEGGLEIVRQTLTYLGYPEEDVTAYIDAIRADRYHFPTEEKGSEGASGAR